MGTPISQRELREDDAAIIRRVLRGERFTVISHGEPVADLGPHQPEGRRRFVSVTALAGLAALPAWGP